VGTEIRLRHPKRIVVEVPGKSVASAYWYLTYSVTNNTDREQMFLPVFEMLTKEGQILRSDINIPARVFDAINAREKKKFLEPYPKITGTLRIGEDQAKDGVAIWPEPSSRMGDFSVFVGGLSGEIAPVDRLQRRADENRRWQAGHPSQDPPAQLFHPRRRVLSRRR